MSSITLKNTATGEIRSLSLPFTEEEWCETLNRMNIPYEQEAWMNGTPFGIMVEEVDTCSPAEGSMLDSNDPLLINAAESAWRECYSAAVDAMIECYGNDDLLEFVNICWQSEDIAFYGYDEGYWHEGYGREMLRWQFGNGEIPAFLEPYINYDEYGRDCESESDDYVCEDGYLSDGGQIDASYYTRDEVISEVLDWDWDYEPENCDRMPEINQELLFNML